jgi:hypothetical protein
MRRQTPTPSLAAWGSLFMGATFRRPVHLPPEKRTPPHGDMQRGNVFDRRHAACEPRASGQIGPAGKSDRATGTEVLSFA